MLVCCELASLVLHHVLAVLHFLHTVLGHMLLELSLFIVNLLLQFNNAMGNSYL